VPPSGSPLFTAEFLNDLNPPQREAVEFMEAPLLVIAGAGSGKTRVITYRIANLAARHGVPPWQILAVTFTNKAAGEMRGRVLHLLGLPSETTLPIGTFHSRCASILRRESVRAGLSERFQILDDDDQIAVVKSVLSQMEIDSKRVKPAQVAEVISAAKSRMLGPEDIAEIEEFQHGDLPYPAIYRAYQDFLDRSDAVDFDDLLLKVVRLFEQHPESLAFWRSRYQHILVDEYQDTNAVQFRLVELLAGEHRHLCVVGDEDQSIYSWRGADIHNLLDFQKHFPEARLVRLEQNYRSTRQILKAADSLIKNNKQRLGKTLFTAGEEGSALEYRRSMDGREEADWVVERIKTLRGAVGIPYSEMAVFYRINSLSRAVEDALRYAKIPYRIVGGIRFYERKEVKDLMAYLRLAESPSNDVAFLRVVNVPKRGIGKSTVENLAACARVEKMPLYQAARRLVEKGELAGRKAQVVQEFLGQIQAWNHVHSELRPQTLLKRILDDTRYIDEELGDPQTLEAITRRENIDELDNVLGEYGRANPKARIGDWLEEIALTASSDTEQGEMDGVSLMTLHCAKGLEFDAVFIIGLEEPLFPLARSVDAQGDDEEERRLFYVGITRARKRLAFSHAISRFAWGQDNFNAPSRFLFELDPGVFAEGQAPSRKAAASPLAAGSFSSFGSSCKPGYSKSGYSAYTPTRRKKSW